MSRQSSGQKSQKQGQGLIRSGLSVQELKAITAVRVGVATELGDKPVSTKIPQSGVRSYQTANANQLVAAGMILQPQSGPVTPTNQSAQYSAKTRLQQSLALPLHEMNHNHSHPPIDHSKYPYQHGEYYLNDGSNGDPRFLGQQQYQHQTVSPRNMSSISTPSSISPHMSPRLSNELSPQIQVAMTQLGIADRNPQDSNYRDAQMHYIQQQQQLRQDPREGNRSRVSSGHSPEMSGFNSARSNYQLNGYQNNVNDNYHSRIVSPRDGQDSYRMISPRDIPDNYQHQHHMVSPKDSKGPSPTLLPTHVSSSQPAHYNDMNLNHNTNGNNMGPTPGLKPVVPPLKALPPTSHHMMKSYPKSELEVEVDYGQSNYTSIGNVHNNQSIFPSSMNSYRSPPQQSPNLNSSAAPFLPSLSSPQMKPPSQANGTKKPTDTMDFTSLERLNGNQFQHDPQRDQPPYQSNPDRLNMNAGGSLSNRLSTGYPLSHDPYASVNHYQQQQKYSAAAGILNPVPLGFRTGSETNLLALEIAESILDHGSLSCTPELNPNRKPSGESPSTCPPILSIHQHVADANIYSINNSNSPGHMMRVTSASASYNSDAQASSLPTQISRHSNIMMSGQQVISPSSTPYMRSTPRDFSPRMNDGWLSGRIEEPSHHILSPRSPPRSAFPSPVFRDSSQDEGYPFFDTKHQHDDEDSDADSTIGEADQEMDRMEVNMNLSFMNEPSTSKISGVTLPFKYESNFYQ